HPVRRNRSAPRRPSWSARGASRSTGTTATTPASTPGACSAPGAPPTPQPDGGLGGGVALAPVEAVVHQRADDGARLRVREVEALAEVAAGRAELLELAGRLDALRGDRQAERVAELHDRGDDRRALRVLAQRLDERLVDLQRVHRQRPQVRERRVPGPEVVD